MEWIESAFLLTGQTVSRRAAEVFGAMLLVTFLATLSIPFTKVQDDVRTGYTPRGARSYEETAVYNRFFSNQGRSFQLYVMVVGQNRTNMLNSKRLGATIDLLNYLSYNITVPDHNGVEVSFSDFCQSLCRFNEPVRLFYNGFIIQTDLVRQSRTTNRRIELSYPIMTILGREVHMGPYLFGVRKSEKNSEKNVTDIDFLPLIILQFRVERAVDERAAVLTDRWGRHVITYLKRLYVNEDIRALGVTDVEIGREIVRTGMSLLPFVSVGFLAMTLFASLTISVRAFLLDQFTPHTLLLALAACLSPLLACVTAFGILFWFGVTFKSILGVTPFLVLAIGVDDAFLMLHSWEGRGRGGEVGPVLARVGPSMAVTSLTNVLAFSVGLFTPTPTIRLFCGATAFAMFVDFIYQITFFASLITLVSKWSPSVKPNQDRAVHCDGKTGWKRRLLDKMRASLNTYSRFLSNKLTFLAILALLIVYWCIAIFGTIQIESKLTPDKLFLRGSLMKEINEIREQYIWPYFTVCTVLVMEPGDLRDANRLTDINRMVLDFEAFNESFGPGGTQFWLRDFNDYTAFSAGRPLLQLANQSTVDIWTEYLGQFLQWPEYEHWNAFIRLSNVSTANSSVLEVDSFLLTVAFKGDDLSEWAERAKLLTRWRQVADRYGRYGVSVYEPDAFFLDQISSMSKTTLQAAAVTFVCMALVCALFMHNMFSVTVACLAILSIVLGVFGFLSLFWQLDLDPISMSTSLMSIGFSVDFVAHITYHYHRTRGKVEERVAGSVEAVAWPLLQAALSTLITVCSMVFVNTYMSAIFIKTVLLVLLFGTVHGLIIVPSFMARLSQFQFTCPAPTTIDLQ